MKKILLLAGICLCLLVLTVQLSAGAGSLMERAQPLLDAGKYDEAVPLLKAAAERGDPAARNELGKCYQQGLGVEQSVEEAARYFRMAADQGYAKSQYNLANFYANGTGVEQDLDKAVAYYQLAAEQGLPHAQTMLGYYYRDGIAVEQNDETAAEYFKLAADQGYAPAQNSLACCYFDGTGVEQNYEEGMKYFRLAAEQGEPDAVFNLGYNYFYGEGVETDYDKALAYFREAAELEHPSAYFLIGECYDEGKGVAQDRETAARWYRKALAAGYEPDEEDKLLLTAALGEGYEKERSQAIIEEMLVDYGSYGEEAAARIEVLLRELKAEDADKAARWEKIMALWKTEPALNYGVLPDGLDDTDGLCLVVLGFQLEADGSMREELVERLRVAKACAEKYPNALIVCTGGGTAAENKAATEAGKMAEWLIENGVAPERVIVEDRSLTTAQNAIYTLDILALRYPQVRELAIISSDYHIATGTLLFGAEAILRADNLYDAPLKVVSNAAWKAPSGSLPPMFQAGALIELSGDTQTAFAVYYDTYDIHELPPIE